MDVSIDIHSLLYLYLPIFGLEYGAPSDFFASLLLDKTLSQVIPIVHHCTEQVQKLALVEQ